MISFKRETCRVDKTNTTASPFKKVVSLEKKLY